jgi:hypothetical protein
MFFCVKYAVNGVEYWDNNNSANFQVDFRKKTKPQNGKEGMQPASAQPANGLPRSQKKTSPLSRPQSMPATFGVFAEGFDPEFDFSALTKQPVNDFLGGAGLIRLKGVKSTVNKLTKNPSSPSGQPFSNRYDFGASLSATIQATNTALGGCSGITMKPSASVLASQSYNELLDKYCFVCTH